MANTIFDDFDFDDELELVAVAAGVMHTTRTVTCRDVATFIALLVTSYILLVGVLALAG